MTGSLSNPGDSDGGTRATIACLCNHCLAAWRLFDQPVKGDTIEVDPAHLRCPRVGCRSTDCRAEVATIIRRERTHGYDPR